MSHNVIDGAFYLIKKGDELGDIIWTAFVDDDGFVTLQRDGFSISLCWVEEQGYSIHLLGSNA